MTTVMRRLLLGLLLAGCSQGPTVSPTGAFAIPTSGTVTGAAADGDALWFLVAGQGLLETTRTGQAQGELRYSATFPDSGFTDVAVRPDGKFVLTSNGEAYLYDPADTVRSYFCLLPTWEDSIQMENQAVAIDADADRIFVDPTYYDRSNNDAIVQAELARYTLSGGAYTGGANLVGSGLVAEGLAWDARLGALWAVQGDQLHRVTPDGVITATTTLDGVIDAAGLALIGDTLYVVDGTTVHEFDRAALMR